ncbi:MAG TPA: LptA/OstA family protein [Capillibacterium sp.]
MSSRRFLWQVGLGLLVMLAVPAGGRLAAAEKGYFKGIDYFYGDTDGRHLYMEGTALEYYQGETHLRFNKAAIREVEDGSREIIFEGEVILTREDFKVSGDRFCYNTATEDGIFTGKVLLERAETRDEAGQVVKEGITLACGQLYLQTAKKAFTASEQPTVEYKDFRGSGQTVSYRDEEEKLTISGGFHLWTKEDELSGEEICFDLRQKTFTARRGGAPLELRLEINKKEEKEAEQPEAEATGKEATKEKQPGEGQPEEGQAQGRAGTGKRG